MMFRLVRRLTSISKVVGHRVEPIEPETYTQHISLYIRLVCGYSRENGRDLLSGDDAVLSGSAVEVLTVSFEQSTVSSNVIQNHSGVDRSRTDVGVLNHEKNAQLKRLVDLH